MLPFSTSLSVWPYCWLMWCKKIGREFLCLKVTLYYIAFIERTNMLGNNLWQIDRSNSWIGEALEVSVQLNANKSEIHATTNKVNKLTSLLSYAWKFLNYPSITAIDYAWISKDITPSCPLATSAQPMYVGHLIFGAIRCATPIYYNRVIEL